MRFSIDLYRKHLPIATKAIQYKHIDIFILPYMLYEIQM